MAFFIRTTAPVKVGPSSFDQELYQADSSGAPVYGSIVFTRDMPDHTLHKTNLLTVTFNARVGGLRGVGRSQTASLTADNRTEDSAGIPDHIRFSSDFLIFPEGSAENLALSFTSANPCFAIRQITGSGPAGCTASGQTLSFLHDFTAAGTGSFASEPTPVSVFAPDPETATLLVSGMGLCFLGRFRQARRSEHA